MTDPKTYTVLTTCPDYGSRNVGDRLIEIRLKELLENRKGSCRFATVFREESLEQRLDEINQTKAILMPAFPVRDTPMHPGTYRLVDDLERIRVPMVPVGANWNVYPGDGRSRRETTYSPETTAFLQAIAGQVEHLSCREQLVRRVLAKHGVENTVFTGDPAMFHLPCLGKPMKRPNTVRTLVFSPPLSPYYIEQALHVLDMLAELFPEAERWCAFHLDDRRTAAAERTENSAALSPDVTRKNERIRERAQSTGWRIFNLAGKIEEMRHYEACDLHVGYECHAHLYFLSSRIPSVLIAEDARGVGFNYTLGVGGVTGFARSSVASRPAQKTMTSGYCTSLDELAVAPPRTDVDEIVRGFLMEEMATGFRRYLGLADFLDETFECAMGPFLDAL